VCVCERERERESEGEREREREREREIFAEELDCWVFPSLSHTPTPVRWVCGREGKRKRYVCVCLIERERESERERERGGERVAEKMDNWGGSHP